jgi:hypothetical protein
MAIYRYLFFLIKYRDLPKGEKIIAKVIIPGIIQLYQTKLYSKGKLISEGWGLTTLTPYVPIKNKITEYFC